MVYTTYTFGETPEEVIETILPETYSVELKYRDAEVVNKVLFNKEDSHYFSKVFNKKELIKLLRSLKSVALDNISFWTKEEADTAYSLRSSILLTLGIEEV